MLALFQKKIIGQIRLLGCAEDVGMIPRPLEKMLIEIKDVFGWVMPFRQSEGSWRLSIPKIVVQRYRLANEKVQFLLCETDKGLLMMPVREKDMRVLVKALAAGAQLLGHTAMEGEEISLEWLTEEQKRQLVKQLAQSANCERSSH
jgi:hypothetical protein